MIAEDRQVPTVAQPRAIPFFRGNQLLMICCVETRFSELETAVAATTDAPYITKELERPYRIHTTAKIAKKIMVGILTPHLAMIIPRIQDTAIPANPPIAENISIWLESHPNALRKSSYRYVQRIRRCTGKHVNKQCKQDYHPALKSKI